MGSTGKVALSVIMSIGAITGILCYYAFALVAPEPGKMTHVTNEPLPGGPGQTSASSSASEVGESQDNAPQTTTANTSAENATTTTSASTAASNASTASTAGAPPATTAAATLKIPQGASVQGNPSYDPDTITVKAGDTIAVENEDSTPHTVTNGKDATDPNMGKLFDTSIINAGDSSEIVTTDLKPGEYPFFCSVHPYMTGSMTVQ
jgi:cytochrome c oxidase subunit 2